jgi:hypothetical protein
MLTNTLPKFHIAKLKRIKAQTRLRLDLGSLKSIRLPNHKKNKKEVKKPKESIDVKAIILSH